MKVEDGVRARLRPDLMHVACICVEPPGCNVQNRLEPIHTAAERFFL